MTDSLYRGTGGHNYIQDEENEVIQTLEEMKKAVEEGVRENSDKLWGEGYTAGILYERNRIEEIFKKHVPPHAMDLEDSVWLKRLLNKAFNHIENI